MSWVARLAARRVVWIIVGVVVYAILSAVGVRAATPLSTVAPAANVTLVNGTYTTIVAATPEEGTYLLTGFVLYGNCSIAQTLNTRFIEGASTVLGSTASTLSGSGYAWQTSVAVVVTSDGTKTYTLQGRSQCNGVIAYKDNAYLSNEGPATKIVIEPVGEGGSPPALTADDQEMLTAGFGIVIALMTAVLVSIGLRR